MFSYLFTSKIFSNTPFNKQNPVPNEYHLNILIENMYTEGILRSMESESVLVRLKKQCCLSLDNYWAGCRHFSDKHLPRVMDVSQPSDTQDVLQQAAIMQGKEKGSSWVNLSLTIVMPSAHYSPLSNFISLSNFHPYIYWCVTLEFCSIKLMEVGKRACQCGDNVP